MQKHSLKILEKLKNESVFELCEEDVNAVFNGTIEFYRKIAKSEGFVFEKMTEKELVPRLAAKSIKEVLEREKSFSVDTVKNIVICGAVLQKDISEIEPNKDNMYKLQNEFFIHVRKMLEI